MRLHFKVFAFCFCVYKICYAEETTNGLSPTPQYLDDLLSSFKYDKFAEIMKIENTDLVNASHRKSSAGQMFYYSGTDLGDILLRPGQLLNPDQLKYFDGIISLSIKKWENGIVPYYLSKEYADNETQFIKNEIEKDNKVYAPQILIRPYQDGDPDFVFIFKGGCGCYSNLGKVLGPQVISMSSPCISNGSISHEMTHTLGIPHASNRLDRDDYITLMPKNIPETMKSQYARYSSDNPANLGKLDYLSKVFYPADTPGFGSPSFNIKQDGIDRSEVGSQEFLSADTPGFGSPSFNIKQDGIDRSEVGSQEFLSDEDIKRAKRFYS